MQKGREDNVALDSRIKYFVTISMRGIVDGHVTFSYKKIKKKTCLFYIFKWKQRIVLIAPYMTVACNIVQVSDNEV